MKKISPMLCAVLLLAPHLKAYNTTNKNNRMTFGEEITAPGAFATDLGADILTLGHGHQTSNYVSRNRSDGKDASSNTTTIGETLMTPLSGTLNIFSGQTHQQGRRNFHVHQQDDHENRSRKRKKSSHNHTRHRHQSHEQQKDSTRIKDN